ncbi:MAG: hypothetical protein GY943_29310 [Chloroflexi bacterium]|nr:hypothetical protein [Chloroflexota bacterium]
MNETMSGDLLQTKLYVPRLRPLLTPRPHLIKQLNQGLQQGCKLTLISAPAGFGKTTLLTEWLATQSPIHNDQSSIKTAWLSLDGRDNDPARFLAYFVAALEQIDGNLGQTFTNAPNTFMPSGKEPLQETLLISLLNEIGELPHSFRLVLDDYHVITNTAVQNILTFLLDNLPPQMHLVISTRADTPWALSRLRVRQQINEIRAKELRFTAEETAVFLNKTMALTLSPEDVTVLEARTEGWIAGLQLAALTLQKDTDNSQFIRTFASSNRFIFDYLAEEVLERQPPELQDFLLQTSILAQMNSQLCAAVLEQDETQETLKQLEQNNLFLIPLDNEQQWYRYHRLFADLLHNRLRQTIPNQIPILHLRAAAWFAQEGMIAEAVSHARAANDLEQMVRLVKGNAFAMLDIGELTTLKGWLDALPDKVVLAEPWMSLFYAWTLAYLGQTDAVEQHLKNAEQGLACANKEDGQHLSGQIAAIRTFLAKLKGEMLPAVQLANQALTQLPVDDFKTRSFVAAMLGTVLQQTGDLAAAARAFNTAVSSSRKAGNSHMAVHALCDLAGLQLLQGRLNKADATCREALELAENSAKRGGRPLPGADFAHARLSGVLLRRNELDAALHHAQQGFELSQQRGQADILTFCALALTAVQFELNDEHGWRQTLRQVRQVERDTARHNALIDFVEVEFGLLGGDVETAVAWAEANQLHADNEIQPGQTFYTLFLARLLIAQNKTNEALTLLERLLAIEEKSGAMGLVISIHVLQTIAWQTTKNNESALTALKRAISLAEPEGYVRIFMEDSAIMQPLLQQLAHQGIATAYVNQLLSALENENKSATTEPSLPEPLEEPLSDREIEVLRLMETDLRAPEIADQIFVSVHTVRSHIKSIYRKLNVHSRYEAVAKAQELALL